MKKVTLSVTEKLTYQREVIVNIPDDMSEDDLNEAINRAQRRADFVDDFVSNLKKAGIELAEPYDDDLSSPWDIEIECEDYDFPDS